LKIRDPGLQRKIRHVQEGAGEVVRHIERNTDPERG